MRYLTAPTEYDVVAAAKTVLAESMDAGESGAVSVENAAGMHGGNIAKVVIGPFGSEGSEDVTITDGSDANNTLTLGTNNLPHKSGEVVTAVLFDKRKFYGATSEDGTYAELTSYGSPVAIAFDDPQGTTIEYDGDEGYTHFKSTYYDSVNDVETDIDDAVAVAGDQSSRYCTLWGIKVKARLQDNAAIGDDRWEDARTAAESKVAAALAAQYSMPISSVPGIVRELTRRLAAAYVLEDELGGGEGSEAAMMLKSAERTCSDIASGKIQVVDEDGSVLAAKTSGTIAFYPNETSRGDSSDPTAQRMPRNRVY